MSRLFFQTICICADLASFDQVKYNAFALAMLFSWIGLLQQLKIFTGFRFLTELIILCICEVVEFLFVVFFLMSGFTLALFWKFKENPEDE
jgi:hypothetical protein